MYTCVNTYIDLSVSKNVFIIRQHWEEHSEEFRPLYRPEISNKFSSFLLSIAADSPNEPRPMNYWCVCISTCAKRNVYFWKRPLCAALRAELLLCTMEYLNECVSHLVVIQIPTTLPFDDICLRLYIPHFHIREIHLTFRERERVYKIKITLSVNT